MAASPFNEPFMLNLPSHLTWPIRAPAVLPALALAFLATGCATATTARHDPLEPVNRKVFAFNEAVDHRVLKPAAIAYKEHVPNVMQTGVSNFFSNLRAPWSSVNLVLQGRVAEGAATAARFGANTTIGVLGFVDVATRWGLPRQRSEDFGLTLDAWGIGSGPYLVLPVFGPSSIRDALALPVDTLGSMEGQIASAAVRNSMTAAQAVSQRANYLELGDLLDQAALDKYVLMRDAHQKRRNRATRRDSSE
jgi:phospholipid-binding lipoprotein MlaA